MGYIYIKIGNRVFAIHKAWIELLVYGSSNYLAHWFIVKFLIHRSFEDFDDDSSKSVSKTSKKHFKKEPKKNNDTKNKVQIVRGGEQDLTNDLFKWILNHCFEANTSNKITHPDLLKKIRAFLQATEASGIKVVPLSVAILAVLTKNKDVQLFRHGSRSILIHNLGEIRIIRQVTIMAAVVLFGTYVVNTKTIVVILEKCRIKQLVKVLPTLPTSVKKTLGELKLVRTILISLGGGVALFPIASQISELVPSAPKLGRSLSAECSEFVQELETNRQNSNLKYLNSYEQPDSRVIIKGNSNRVICIPEKPSIQTRSTDVRFKPTLIEIPMVGGKMYVGTNDRIKKIIAHQECEINFKPYKDEIPEARDFRKYVTDETVNRAEKMAKKTGLLNEGDFDMKPKVKNSPIRVKNDEKEL